MAGSDIAKQIETAADYYPPNLYSILGLFSSIQTSSDSLATEYIPLSQIPFVAKNLKTFAIGLIPPSANVTGRALDRSATIASTLGGAGAAADGAVAGFAEDSRSRALALAQTYIGLSTNPATVGRYRSLLADLSIDTVATQTSLINQASCAPVVRSWFRELGVQAPELSNPYVSAAAPADVLAIAKRAGARMDRFGHFNQTPQPGDVYYITGSAQHMGIIQSVQGTAESGKFTTVDISGGQQLGSDGHGNVYKGVAIATRTWERDNDPESPTYHAWFVKRADGFDIVGEGDDPRGRKVGALIDIEKVLQDVPVSAVPQNVLWQKDGKDNAQAAAKQLSKTSGTGIDPADLGKQFTELQQAVSKAIKAAIDQMAQTPPLRMLVNPTSFKVGSEKIVSDGSWGRNGPIVEHWGEQQDKIEGSGKVAGFYAIDASGGALGSSGNSPGLTRMARNVSLAYQNFLSLYLLYRNNAGIWLPDPTSPQTAQTANLTLIGSVYIFYDNILYVGSFESFTITETDTEPFTVEYSFSFSVRTQFVLDQTDAHFTYGAPATIPGTL
jgi:hypothetical protein